MKFAKTGALSFAAAALLLASLSPATERFTLAWLGSWACSQQIPEPQNALSPDDLRDATLRQIIHLSVGGKKLRLHLSNAFGTAPLHLSAVHIARPISTASSAIDPATDKPLSFDGHPDVTIPAGADYISDTVDYPVAPGADLAVSIHYDDPPQQQTGHPGSRATSYLAHGNFVSARDLPNARKFDHWYQLSGLDVPRGQRAFSIVVLGDSITDGHGATTNGNDRWPDVLARRLQHTAGLLPIGVLNQGIGGNHLLTDGLGPNALSRFDRDVLAQPAVRVLIVFEGVNDLGGLARTHSATAAEHAALVARIIGAYQQIILRADDNHLRVIGATITPYVGCNVYHPDVQSEADRQTVNSWIRTPGNFDALLDFDRIIRDPAHPERMLPAFDSGDHLHPSPAGYAAMANSIPLDVFNLQLP